MFTYKDKQIKICTRLRVHKNTKTIIKYKFTKYKL